MLKFELEELTMTPRLIPLLRLPGSNAPVVWLSCNCEWHVCSEAPGAAPACHQPSAPHMLSLVSAAVTAPGTSGGAWSTSRHGPLAVVKGRRA